ncbi:MAG: GNAT family N-acetyltransferase [bacterium]
MIRSLRRTVLVKELGLDPAIIEDDTDQQAVQFCSTSLDGQTIGVIRLDLDGNISRLAVDPDFRRQGTGFALLEAALGKAQRFDLTEVRVAALTTLDDFYDKAGYSPRGEKFVEQGVEHQQYFRRIDQADVFQHNRAARTGDAYPEEGDVVYKLGAETRFLLLRREDEFRRVVPEMCKQATQSIRILSPYLDHKLFDTQEMREICSSLARRNKYTSIEILLYDSHRIVKNGHVILEISRKLSSSISFKIVHPEMRASLNEFVLVDGTGVIYRQDCEDYEGYANFRDITENNRLGRQFLASWESGLQDPNLRTLKI